MDAPDVGKSPVREAGARSCSRRRVARCARGIIYHLSSFTLSCRNINARLSLHSMILGRARIAQEIARAFGIDIDKDIGRVLAKHYRPEAGNDGPSWLSFIGHMKDSLWSVDLFRCESILLCSHWVMVVMDVFTRRIIGFGVERADLCGALCWMFNQIIVGKSLPQHLSSDHDGGAQVSLVRENPQMIVDLTNTARLLDSGPK
jgi:hypothetical protein